MFTKDFWLGDNGALIKAIRTWAQTAIATIGVGTTNLFSADVKNVLALATSAAILSLLMSLDRREALHTLPPAVAPPTPPPPAAPLPPPLASSDPASADYQPTA